MDAHCAFVPQRNPVDGRIQEDAADLLAERLNMGPTLDPVHRDARLAGRFSQLLGQMVADGNPTCGSFGTRSGTSELLGVVLHN
jgi:hypothetical protein